MTRKRTDYRDTSFERWRKRLAHGKLDRDEKAILRSFERGEWKSDPLFTIAAAAKELGLSVHTIRSWVAQRRIAHVRLGRVIRIKASKHQKSAA
jgi:excisionase family DNA binding protein